MNDVRKETEAAAPVSDVAAANGESETAAADAETPSADERLVTLETELADVKDRLLRALAEAENVRRRAQREREDTLKYAVAGFAKDLLSTADNLRRALDSLPEGEAADARTKGLLAGVAATERELLSAFERHGIRRLDPKGERFDHNYHQAVFEVENSEQPPGTVVEVLQPGYVLHDRLLRPAMVGVAKEGPKPTRAEPANAP
jgi:molecular chaperone GrpE